MAVTQETSDKLTTKDLMRSLIQTGQLDTAAQAEVAQKWLLRVANRRVEFTSTGRFGTSMSARRILGL